MNAFCRPEHPVVMVLAAVMAVGIMAGCSNPGTATCDEYASQPYSERKKTVKALLEAHNLETISVSNTLGLQQALSKYCGVYGFNTTDKAGSNGSSPIDKAVNWASEKW
ncbi:hypothetical protein [Paenarthrobacter aurescens]|jgi:hypothetical protein|uniref:Lipoprotein n=1 Tax=Paenarthrobacter aurescens (strain TC1) TaxID=290340 RepID=A1R1X8_PAEAT|nr:hypothetical protein [Paenarthrobacter aurescens]ABM07727.1 putative lipoprotein [Paenarthrobacter aurescens TC1]